MDAISFLLDLSSAAREVERKAEEERRKLLAKHNICYLEGDNLTNLLLKREPSTRSNEIAELQIDMAIVKAALAELGLENWDALREKYAREHNKEQHHEH